MNAVNSNGLFNLNDFLPKKPGEVEVKVMQEMFEASVDGQPYDEDKFSQYFRPAGMSARTGDPNKASKNGTATSMTAPEAKTEAVAETTTTATTETVEVKEPVAEEAKTGGDATDILAMIRARQSQ